MNIPLEAYQSFSYGVGISATSHVSRFLIHRLAGKKLGNQISKMINGDSPKSSRTASEYCLSACLLDIAIPLSIAFIGFTGMVISTLNHNPNLTIALFVPTLTHIVEIATRIIPKK